MNRHLLVRPAGAYGDEETTGIILPQAYINAQEHVSVEVLSVAADCTALSQTPLQGCTIVVPKNMILEISTGTVTYNLIQENYILGVITPS